MNLETPTNPGEWLTGQGPIVAAIFEEALDEMQTKGFRMRAGSTEPRLDESRHYRRASVIPSRFARVRGRELLCLLLEATTAHSTAHYVVGVEASGDFVFDAFRRLALGSPEAWEAAFLKAGLWITLAGQSRPFTQSSQILGEISSKVQIAAAFPPSLAGRTLKQAVMILGLLYRSAIDEFSASGRMPTMVSLLRLDLGGYLPRFQRIIPP